MAKKPRKPCACARWNIASANFEAAIVSPRRTSTRLEPASARQTQNGSDCCRAKDSARLTLSRACSGKPKYHAESPEKTRECTPLQNPGMSARKEATAWDGYAAGSYSEQESSRWVWAGMN